MSFDVFKSVSRANHQNFVDREPLLKTGSRFSSLSTPSQHTCKPARNGVFQCSRARISGHRDLSPSQYVIKRNFQVGVHSSRPTPSPNDHTTDSYFFDPLVSQNFADPLWFDTVPDPQRPPVEQSEIARLLAFSSATDPHILARMLEAFGDLARRGMKMPSLVFSTEKTPFFQLCLTALLNSRF